MRLSLLAGIAAAAAALAAAASQTVPGGRLQSRPVPPAAQTAPSASQVSTAAADPEQLRRTIARLEREKKDLAAQLQTAQGRIDQMSHPGGSLVKAYCAGDTLSRNTAGAETDCRQAGGYMCEPVSGLCRQQCQTSDMCAPGYLCDTSVSRCVPQPR
jgi:hypothetical protein